MFSKKTCLWIAAALSVAGTVTGGWFGWHGRGARTQAAWAYTAHNLSELSAHAGAVVLARAGRTEFSRLAYSDDGEDTLPFEVTEFTVVRSLRGPQADEMILVERAGGEDPVDLVPVEIDADGGAFERDATYLLFLEEQPGGPYWFQINDQARYRVRGERLEALDEHDPVSEVLHGKPVEAGWALVRRSLGL